MVRAKSEERRAEGKKYTTNTQHPTPNIMIIPSPPIQLILTNSDDPEIRAQLEALTHPENLSETRFYPAGMPERMIFRIEQEGRLAGEIRLQAIRWFNRRAEISIFIAEDFRGKGLGKAAVSALIHHAFTMMNLHRLEVEVYEYNRAGNALFRHFGFLEEGRLREARYFDGKYWDIIRYGLLRGEYE